MCSCFVCVWVYVRGGGGELIDRTSWECKMRRV